MTGPAVLVGAPPGPVPSSPTTSGAPAAITTTPGIASAGAIEPSTAASPTTTDTTAALDPGRFGAYLDVMLRRDEPLERILELQDQLFGR